MLIKNIKYFSNFFSKKIYKSPTKTEIKFSFLSKNIKINKK